jgi:hypothetical protein
LVIMGAAFSDDMWVHGIELGRFTHVAADVGRF